MAKVVLATCQFKIEKEVEKNLISIKRQMKKAKDGGAHLVHFSEACLSGYLGAEIKSLQKIDWDRVAGCMREVMAFAEKLRLWVVVGCNHRLSGNHKPHNSLYVINPQGQIVDRYDKRFCTKTDLRSYSPGDHFVVFEVKGIKCGLLICYDVRFPEVYRQYAKLGVQLMLHSFYNARAKGPGIHRIIMRPSLQARAATNYFWISASNSSAYYSWPSVFIQPDGEILEQLKINRPGIMVNVADTTTEYYDASKPHRGRAMRGILNSGQLVDDVRSRDRQSL